MRETPEYSPEEWEALKIVLGFCQRCGISEDLTKDHVTPIGRGGRNNLGNLSVLCRTCNQEKGTKKTPRYTPTLLLPSQQSALESLSPVLRDRVEEALGLLVSHC